MNAAAHNPADLPSDPGQWIGQRVAVVTQVVGGSRTLTQREEGVVVSFEQRKTGSWYAHSKDDKLWLDRLTLRKDDGEVYMANLDALARIEWLNAPPEASAEQDQPVEVDQAPAEASSDTDAPA
ncbi:MAG: hypothetical protein AAF288_02835 [Planctomycetota bacterium]